MKHKFIASLLCICLLLCSISMMPEKRAQAKTVYLTSNAITVVKGQYAFIGLKMNSKVQWSVAGGNIKIHKTSGKGKPWPYCYVKAVKTGTGIVKCIVNKKILKCKVKVLAKSAFIGDFTDDAREVYLDIFKNGSKYVGFFRQFRLAQMDWLEGTIKNGILTLSGSDPAGKPITVTLSCKGSKRIFTFKKTVWEHFTQGSTVILKKCSGSDGYKHALAGFM